MLREIWYALCTTCRPHKSRTVRYAFPLFLIAVLFAGTAAVVTKSGSYIEITTSPESVQQGEKFTMLVTATAHTPVNAVDIVIEYPPSQIEVTGIDTGESVISLWTEEPYAEDGKIYLRGGTFRKGFLGTHTIARVRATAIESGTAHVTKDSVTFIAGDGKGTPVSVGSGDGDSAKVYIANADGSIVGTASVVIVTDVDGDGDVDLKDISSFMAAWFNKNSTYDFNGDGRMSFIDFSILLADSFFK